MFNMLKKYRPYYTTWTLNIKIRLIYLNNFSNKIKAQLVWIVFCLVRVIILTWEISPGLLCVGNTFSSSYWTSHRCDNSNCFLFFSARAVRVFWCFFCSCEISSAIQSNRPTNKSLTCVKTIQVKNASKM